MNLYTKYRSQKFSDIVGQKHVVRVLTSAISHSRAGHAYLFSGPRGTGKTSIARLLAKSLNCINREKSHFEPCNHCQSCKEIMQGVSMDIIEIDAASNRGIDEIRALRDKVRFAPSGIKYKIFIIDEVHMLTREAFNALLKTLEEPPKHAIFILATTELHKVPDTIVSRTQQFDFHLHSIVDIFNQLISISKKEAIKIDQESLKLIAINAQGGLRDAISLLDQVSNISGKINENLTREILGLASHENLYNFTELLNQKNTVRLIEMLKKLYQEGIDFSQFITEVIEFLRQMLLSKFGYQKAFSDFTADERKKLEKLALNFEKSELLREIERLLRALEEIKKTNMPDLSLEIAILDLTLDSIPQKPTKKDQPTSVRLDSASAQRGESARQARLDSARQVSPSKLTKKTTFNSDKLKDDWQNIIAKIADNHSFKILLKNSVLIKVENNTLIIGVEFKLYKDRLESKKIYESLSSALDKYLGEKYRLKFKVDSSLIKRVVAQEGKQNELLTDAVEVFG